jgi:hypothetical protein
MTDTNSRESVFFDLQLFSDGQEEIQPETEDIEENWGKFIKPQEEAKEKQTEPETQESPVEQAESTPQENKPDEPKYKIRVANEDIEMPLSEILKRAQMGEDYTRKTQKVAEERKQLEEQRQQFDEWMKQYEQQRQAQAPQPVQQKQENPREEFKRLYGEDFMAFDDNHVDKMNDIIERRAIEKAAKQAEEKLSKIMESKQKEQEVGQVKTELTNLASFISQNPQEVQQFIESTMWSLAGDEKTRADFESLYPALKKVYAVSHNQMSVEQLTASEVKKLHDFAVKATRDYYATKKSKAPPVAVETSTNPVPQTDKKLTAEQIRNMDVDESARAFGAFLKRK